MYAVLAEVSLALMTAREQVQQTAAYFSSEVSSYVD